MVLYNHNTFYSDSNGNPVTQSVVGVTDANGNPVTDASGNPVTQLVTTVTPVAVPVTDASGNAVTGNTIYSINKL